MGRIIAVVLVGVKMVEVMLFGIGQKKDNGVISQNESCEFPGFYYLSERLYREGIKNKVYEDTTPQAISKINEPDLKVVGFSIFGTNYPASIDAAKKLKEKYPGLVTVFGGPLASNFPVSDPNIDYFVSGEGEETFAELCKLALDHKDISGLEGLVFFEDGKRIETRKRKRESSKELSSVDVEKLHPHNFDRYKKHIPHSIPFENMRYALVSGSRGCVYACDFCDNDSMWNRKVTIRSPESVLEEIEFLVNRGVNYIGFMDSDFLMNDHYNSWTTTIAEGILDRGIQIKYHVMSNIRSPIKFDNLDLLKESGCVEISLGMESSDSNVIRAMGKHFDRDEIDIAVNKVYNAGIFPSLYVLFGHPEESEEGLEEQYNFLKGINWCRLRSGFVIPYPGTALYRRVEQDNLWLNGYRNHFELMTGDRPVIRTSVNPERLVYERKRLLRLYFSDEYSRRFRKVADESDIRANKEFLRWLEPMVN